MIHNVQSFIFPAAFALLPGVMDSLQARAMLLAIGLQESRFLHRRQVGGPARGFWQFEKNGGVRGVLQHPATILHAKHVCEELRYPVTIDACYVAIEHNDVLACCLARLLLWTVPGMLANRGDPDKGWEQYMDGWRPGKPHRETWDEHFVQAWHIVTEVG